MFEWKEVKESFEKLNKKTIFDYKLLTPEDASKVQWLLEQVEILQEEKEKEESKLRTLTCKGIDGEGFENAIKQLGYTVQDETWDDEKDVLTYQVNRKKESAS